MSKKLGYLNEDTFPNIANAIRTRNGLTTTYTPAEMPAAILAISGGIDTSDATATAADILEGKTAYSNGNIITGTISTATSVNETINPGESKTIPSGYYTSDNTITASLADSESEIDSSLKTSGTTLTINPGGSATVSSGKYYTSDNTITASLADSESEIDSSLKTSGTTLTINPGGSATVSSGKYYTSDNTITANLATTGDQIDSTIKAPGVVRTLSPGESYTLDGNIYRTSDTTITADLADAESEIADSIKLGNVNYSPSVNRQVISAGKYLTGDQVIEALTVDNMPNDLKETQTVTGPLTGSSTINATSGKVMTSITINAPDLSAATANAADIVEGKTAYGSDGSLITGTHTEAGGVDTSDATATAADILSGKTAYISSGKAVGTLEVLNYYSSTSEPDSSLGNIGDLYMQLES